MQIEMPKKALQLLPPEINNNKFQLLYQASKYSFKTFFRVTESFKARGYDSCTHAEETISFGDMVGNNLANLYPWTNEGFKNYKTDYSAQDIIELRNELKAAKSKVNEITSKLGDFGEYET
jgi:hypothetical protein